MGYAPIGKKINYNKIQEIEKKAENIYINNNNSYEGGKKLLMKALIKEFLDYVENEN